MNEEQFDSLCQELNGVSASLVGIDNALRGIAAAAGLDGDTPEEDAVDTQTVKLAERIFVSMAASGGNPDPRAAFTLAVNFRIARDAFWTVIGEQRAKTE